MTARASAWFEIAYTKGVTHVLQHRGYALKPAMTAPDEINGLTVNWRIVGSGEANEQSPAIEDVAVMNADRSMITATMRDWEANDWIKKTDLNKMSVTEQDKVQVSGGMAMGRRFDRIIIAALDAAGAAIPTIGDGSAAISITDIINAQGEIFDEGGAGYEYYAAIPAKFMTHLEVFREFSSAEFVGPEYPLLRTLGARRYRGVTIIPLPQKMSDPTKRFFNVPAANQADGFMWASGSLGFAQAETLNSRIDYVPQKKSYLAVNDMAACAAVLMPEGVRRLRFAMNVALTRPTP
jgi:hypothetical protein